MPASPSSRSSGYCRHERHPPGRKGGAINRPELRSGEHPSPPREGGREGDPCGGALDPIRVDIVDDSAKHAGHAGAGGGAHFRLTIVSPKFAGLATMARHRLVYEAADDLMSGSIHALSITTMAPEEV